MTESATTLLAPTALAGDSPSLGGRVRRALGDAVVRRGMLSVFDQAVVSGTSFVTSVLIGRLCSPGDLGVYYLALSIVLFIRGIQQQIISAPFAVYCHREEGRDLAAYTGSTLVHQVGFLAASMFGLAGFVWLASSGLGEGFRTAAWAVLIAAPLMLFREYLRHIAFGRLALRTAIGLDVCVAVVQIGGLAILAAAGSLTVVNVYLVMAAACGLATIGWFALRAEPVRFTRARWMPDWKRNWSFSRWAVASHLVGSSTPYLLPWCVAAFEGTTATGVLAACTTLVGLANAFIMGLSNYLTPTAAQAYARGGVDALRSVLKKMILLFFVTIGGFAIVTVFAGGWIAAVVYGNEYAESGAILAILAFALCAGSLSMTVGNGLWAMEKPSANFRADVWCLVVTVASLAALTPMLGVLGAALATLVGAVVDVVVRGWTLHRHMRQDTEGRA